MEELSGAVIFWLISIGLLLGGILKLIFRNRGLGTATNIGGGVLGMLIVGIIGIEFQLVGSLLFAFLGTLAMLALANLFFAGEDQDAHNIKNGAL